MTVSAGIDPGLFLGAQPNGRHDPFERMEQLWQLS